MLEARYAIRSARVAVAILFGLIIGGCPQRTGVWIREGSTSNDLVLEFGKERGKPGNAAIGAIRVYRCDAPATGAGAAWVVGPASGTADVPQIRYGETPVGFTSDQGPQPLVSGCYRVDISGTGKTEFVIDSAG